VITAFSNVLLVFQDGIFAVDVVVQ